MENAGIIAMLQGEAKSGKTAFLKHALKQEDSGKPCYEPTVEDEYSVAEMVRGKAVTLTYLDTGGNAECEGCIPDWVSRAHFQVLFINLERASSLDYLRLKTSIFETAKRSLVGGMLIGNLPSGNAANRKVSKQEALNLAASFSWAEFSYVELNTVTGQGVDAAVSTLMESVGKSLSGAEQRCAEAKEPIKPLRDLQEHAWLSSLGMSKEACEVLRRVPWSELKVMFASDVPIIKRELEDYGVSRASDRNKLIAGWQQSPELERIKGVESRLKSLDGLVDQLERRNASLQARVDALEGQLQAAQGRVEVMEGQLQVAQTRVDVLETQQSDASWTHRIQELLLKQLQAVGLAKKDGPSELTIPSKSRSPSPEENTPVKSKTVQVRVGRPKAPPSRGGLFSTTPLK